MDGFQRLYAAMVLSPVDQLSDADESQKGQAGATGSSKAKAKPPAKPTGPKPFKRPAASVEPPKPEAPEETTPRKSALRLPVLKRPSSASTGGNDEPLLKKPAALGISKYRYKNGVWGFKVGGKQEKALSVTGWHTGFEELHTEMCWGTSFS